MVLLQEPISLAFLLISAALLLVLALPSIREKREEALQE
jgi:TctA family transporter